MGAALGFFCASMMVLAQDPPLADVAKRVDARMVKVFGAGGVRGLPAYGTGIMVSPTGHVLTVNNHILDTTELRVHLADGTRVMAKVVASEPELDLALLKIEDSTAPDDLPFFDLIAAAKAPPPKPGTLVLGFSNQFQIATRDEPLTVQRGILAGITPLAARTGAFLVPYRGPALIVDAITNNPGAAGGALTTRSGELLAIVGREVSNELTQTWVNYAIPVWASVELTDAGGATRKVSVSELVEKKEKYKPSNPADRSREKPATVETGIMLVPDVVERTPPYIDYLPQGGAGLRAGLRPDDLILSVEGTTVATIASWKEMMAGRKPGQPVRLEVRRGEKIELITLTPDKPANPPAAAKPVAAPSAR